MIQWVRYLFTPINSTLICVHTLNCRVSLNQERGQFLLMTMSSGTSKTVSDGQGSKLIEFCSHRTTHQTPRDETDFCIITVLLAQLLKLLRRQKCAHSCIRFTGEVVHVLCLEHSSSAIYILTLLHANYRSCLPFLLFFFLSFFLVAFPFPFPFPFFFFFFFKRAGPRSFGLS